MIVELAVENLAIIESTRLDLESGFTVLTGETGAGKSLLIDAVELALGDRADTELVRTGAKAARVHVAFDLSDAPAALARLRELDIEAEDGLLTIDRSIAAEGRSQARINGRLTPASVLRGLGKTLIDLHGQHDHQSLLDPERHLGYLDAWIGSEADAPRTAVARDFERWQTAQARLNALRRGVRDREQRLDLLRFQIEEIESADIREGEMAELEADLNRLKFAERIGQAVFGALSGLADDEKCAIDCLGDAVRLVGGAEKFDPALSVRTEALQAALVTLEDAVSELRTYSETLEDDPAHLEVVAGRIDTLKKLRRKYGADEAGILAHLQSARTELELLENAEASEEEAGQAEAKARRTLEASASALKLIRVEKSVVLAELVEGQLRELAMARAIFQIIVRDKPVTPDGTDDVEFFFSANAGEAPKPLAKIASGGEISRVMLAIKTALAGRAGVPTLVFDEVDAGMGGRTAATVGKKLAELAKHRQVLVISHLPQVASQAARHFRIEKIERNGRVVTEVRLLEGQDRVEEIARMLAGERLTPAALENARQMIEGS
ncbi:DNA repair protein RecN [soil metagenome]